MMQDTNARPALKIDPEFQKLMLQTIDDPQGHPVHLLFNQFWAYMPDPVRDTYAASFRATDEGRRWIEAKWFPPESEFASLKTLPPGSLGRAVHDHIVENNLNPEIALGYRKFHQILEASGMLKNMPEDVKYAVLRGFQVHDIEHIITGLNTTPLGEIALQAFGLAQRNFLYQAIWISTRTTRMAYCEPERINELMNAITLGWTLGKKTPNLAFIRWEEMFAEPVEALRRRFGIEAVAPEELEPARLAA